MCSSDLLTSGKRRIISDRTTPNSLNLFSNPVDILLDEENNQIMVLDDDLNAVIAVDLDSGQRVIFSR